MVDVKDGKILRIRPARYYEQYTKEEVKPWVMHARGKTFEPSEKSLIPPLSLAYKKRVYSPARIRYPMKRVDFDPTAPRLHGPSGATSRTGASASTCASPGTRRSTSSPARCCASRRSTGPRAILYQSDQHGENKVVHGPHGCGRKLLRLFGGYTLQVRQPDSWEGWWWGAKHVWGCEPVGQQVPQKNLLYDISKNAELLLFWGCDQETTTWGWQGQLPSRLSFWWTELGIKQIYIAPDCNYANAVHADKWIPILPNTDAALYLAIAYQWFKNGTYDKEYLETHAYGVDKFEDYVMGGEDGAPKSPEWAAPITGVPARIIKALAAEWASKRTTVVIGNGGPGIRGPYSTEPARLQVLCLAMQGLGKPGCNQSKMIEWGLHHDDEQVSPPAPSVFTSLLAAYTGGTPGDTNPDFVPKTLVPKAILEGSVDWWGNEQEFAPRENQFVHYKYPAEGCFPHPHDLDRLALLDHLLERRQQLHPGDAAPNHRVHLLPAPLAGERRLFADVILPVNTKLEEDDIGNDVFGGQMNLLFPEPRCIEPLGESFSDYEIVCKIAERLGLLEEYTGGKTVPELIRLGYETSGRRAPGQLGGAQREGLLRDPARPGLGEDPGRPDRVLRGPGGASAHHAHRQARVLRHRPGRALPRRRRAGAGAQVDRRGRDAPGDPGHRAEQEVSAAGHEQPPRWGVHSQHDDVTWLREIETCKVTGPGRLPVPPAVDEPGGRRGPGHQARRRGQHLQRAGHGAGRRLRDRADHARRGGHGPRGQVRPHRAGRDRPGRGHQHHRAAQHHVEERRAAWWCRVSWPRWRRPTWRRSSAGTRRPFARECHATAGPCIAGVLMEQARG